MTSPESRPAEHSESGLTMISMPRSAQTVDLAISSAWTP